MANQYALPQAQPVTAGVPPVSPSSRAAHAMLDQTLGALVAKMAPQFASMLPPDKAKQTLRDVMKNGSFLEKQLVMSKVGPYLPKGVTADDLNKAVNEPPPPPEKPAAAPAQAAPVPAVAPAPAPAAKQYALPATVSTAPAAPAAPVVSPIATPAAPAASLPNIAPAPAATRGPTVGAAAAQPQGGNPALDYLAQYGGHASILRDGKIVPVHPGTAGNYAAVNPEFAARLAAAGQAYQQETGKAPAYGEMSRGNDVQQVYYDKYRAGTGGIAAPPGNSRHQSGLATDLPDSGFRQWLYAGNMNRFGLNFPVKGDTPHVQMNPAFKGNFATGAPAAGAAPGTPQPAIQAGAGPAAVAAGRAADAKAIAAGPARSAFPQGTSPDTIAAVNALASKYGLNPAAVAAIIKTESSWNPQAASPGKGTYRGLTQIGPDTFKEAGGKLGGLSYEEYLKATPAQQVAAYGGYLDHYGFADKAKAASIDFSKMTPAQQAAHLQAFQFSPAVADWQGGDPNKPVTTSPQASALGSTSLADMTKYYEKQLANLDGPMDATPNVGAGQSSYDLPATAVASSDSIGGAAANAAASTDTAIAASPAATPGTSFGEGLGGAIGDMGKILGGAASKPAAPIAANLPILPTSAAMAVPMVDPKIANAQRQQLAEALQRLNSRRLV